VAGGVSYRTVVDLVPGIAGQATFEVGPEDTAKALGSGDVEVLGTPRLIALCEEAACRALEPSLAGSPERTTVGVRVQFDHLVPVRVGARVKAEATLERVEGRRLTFTVSASDATGLVGCGKVTRVLVERDAFANKAR